MTDHDTLRLKFIEDEIADIIAKRDAVRIEWKKLGNSLSRYTDKLTKLEEQRAKIVPMDLENALVCRLETGENIAGYKFLEERSYKGDWKDSGLRYAGVHWNETNQRTLSVWSDHTWDDAKLSVQHDKIMEVVGFLKAGIHGKDMVKSLAKSHETINLNEAKVFEIMASDLCESHSYHLANLADGRWVIYDSYSIKYAFKNIHTIGTLMDCLKEIRENIALHGLPEVFED